MSLYELPFTFSPCYVGYSAHSVWSVELNIVLLGKPSKGFALPIFITHTCILNRIDFFSLTHCHKGRKHSLELYFATFATAKTERIVCHLTDSNSKTGKRFGTGPQRKSIQKTSDLSLNAYSTEITSLCLKKYCEY